MAASILKIEGLFGSAAKESRICCLKTCLQTPKGAACWRLASRLDQGGPLRRLLAALLGRYGVTSHGCHIALGARIGPRLRLPHPVGIVIGSEVVIGADVTIYQNVTLGRAHADEGSNPVIKDGVTLYAGAMVIGAVTIGAGAVVGANSVVRNDVAAGTTVVGAPARMVGKHVVA